jgi:alkylhydroperoxidase family enzyme
VTHTREDTESNYTGVAGAAVGRCSDRTFVPQLTLLSFNSGQLHNEQETERNGIMVRVPKVTEENHPDLAGLFARIKTERGTVLNLYKALLNSPPVMEGWLSFFTAIRQQTVLGGAYRELAILLVGLLNSADYEYRVHLPFAIREGVSEAQTEALKTWRTSPLFSDKERVVLQYTETITTSVQVSDELFSEVSRYFTSREVVELTAVIAGYNLVSRILVALQIDQESPTN